MCLPCLVWSFSKEPSSWCAYTSALLGVELSSWSIQVGVPLTWCGAFNSVGVPLTWCGAFFLRKPSIQLVCPCLGLIWCGAFLVWSILLGAFHSVGVPLPWPYLVWSFPAWSLQFSWCAPSCSLLSLVWSYLLGAFESVGVPTIALLGVELSSWSLQPQSIGVPTSALLVVELGALSLQVVCLTLLGVELSALSLQVGVPILPYLVWSSSLSLPIGVPTWCGVQVCLYCLGALGVCLISSGAASMHIN